MTYGTPVYKTQLVNSLVDYTQHKTEIKQFNHNFKMCLRHNVIFKIVLITCLGPGFRFILVYHLMLQLSVSLKHTLLH